MTVANQREIRPSNKVEHVASAISSLYPNLLIDSIDQQFVIVGATADGVELGCLIGQEALLADGGLSTKRYVVLADTPRSELLSHGSMLAGVICLHEDPSSHFSIICRSNGVPIALVDPTAFPTLERQFGRTCAIDTFASQILIGQLSINRADHVARRRQILQDLTGRIGFSISSNADTADDISLAVATGFTKSWPRSETLLYSPDTLPIFRGLLVAPSDELAERFKAKHCAAIRDLVLAASGNRLALRLLDPPAHEFLPQRDDTRGLAEIAQVCGLDQQTLRSRFELLTEQNPMIGHRGCRLLLTHPNLLTAQVQAVLEAWLSLKESERPQFVELFVPFVVTAAELALVKQRIFSIAAGYPDFSIDRLRFGAMIETASIFDYAADVARLVDFVSYGTNDLSGTYYALPRGDCYENFLKAYVAKGLFECDPLFELTDALTSRIIRFSDELRAANPGIEIDVCGEHALGANIWRAIRRNAFTSVSVGVGTLPQFLIRMQEQGIVDLDFAPLTTPRPTGALEVSPPSEQPK
jgi:pyruvate,orthophosphate dikinase